MTSKRLKTLVFTGFSAFYSFLSVKLGIISRMDGPDHYLPFFDGVNILWEFFLNEKKDLGMSVT